jgi:integrase
VASIEARLEPVSPRLRFGTVAGRWLARFETKVAGGERRARTLEAHRYHLERHLLPVFGRRQISSIAVDDVADLLDALQGKGCQAKTVANALATLQSIIRFARRHGWITNDPVEHLKSHERPRPARRRQRALGRDEIERLLGACAPRDRAQYWLPGVTRVRQPVVVGAQERLDELCRLRGYADVQRARREGSRLAARSGPLTVAPWSRSGCVSMRGLETCASRGFRSWPEA